MLVPEADHAAAGRWSSSPPRKPHSATDENAETQLPDGSHQHQRTEYRHAEPPFGEGVIPNAPSGQRRAEAAAETAHEPVGETYYRREEVLETPAAPVEAVPQQTAASASTDLDESSAREPGEGGRTEATGPPRLVAEDVSERVNGRFSLTCC